MIVIYENLGDVYGYYHEGIAHINEELPDYLKKHVGRYLEYFHNKGVDSEELKFRFTLGRNGEEDASAFRYANRAWKGNIEEFLNKEETSDLIKRILNIHPSLSGMSEKEIIDLAIRRSEGEV